MSAWFSTVNSDRGVVSEAVQLHDLDNVATVRRVLTEQPGLCLVSGASRRTIALFEPVPSGHRIAVARIPEGAGIVTHGQRVGIASEDIAVGAQLHVHNVIEAVLA